jgi:hypothetical protein
MDMTVLIQPRGLRTLSWRHFRQVGRPKDEGSDASTGYKLNWSKRGGRVLVTLSLDAATTWVIRGRSNAALLKHEQGHWDIYVLQAEEIDRELQGLPDDQIQARFDEISQKYTDINNQYDSETNHSQNQNKQAEWDCKLASAKRNHTLDLAAICED